MDKYDETIVQENMLQNYVVLRTLVGVLGAAMPILVAGWAYYAVDLELRGSISAYYHTVSRDLFVGTLWIMGLFMIAYRGKRELWNSLGVTLPITDNALSTIAGIASIGVALFPTPPDPTVLTCDSQCATQFLQGVGTWHFVFAGTFFFLTSLIAAYSFPKSVDDLPDDERAAQRYRNMLYQYSGIAIFLLILAIAAYNVFWTQAEMEVLEASNWLLKPVFIFETLAIWLFAAVWWIKGYEIGTVTLRDVGARLASPFFAIQSILPIWFQDSTDT